MLRLLHPLLQIVQVLLIPIRPIAPWVLMGLVLWSLSTFIRDTAARAQQMHRIPCARCRFFTGDYRLKCPVHPTIALSEAAIQCQDYQS
jgi:hypothetical protein